MTYLDSLSGLVNGDFYVPALEVAFYIVVVSVYALLGRVQSCLINTFAFTFYWGFMFLLPISFSSNGLSQAFLLLYVLCGFLIYGSLTLTDLKVPRRFKTIQSDWAQEQPNPLNPLSGKGRISLFTSHGR